MSEKGSLIGRHILQYHITSRLGVGGMGEVYLATDAKLDRPVALKFLSPAVAREPEARERLIREAKAASQLNHKNILTIYAVEQAEGRDFIVMEYVEGRSLRELIDAGELTATQALRLGMQVCDGLAAAHEQGITHRDIKPANILVTARGQAKITDFGLATWRGASRLTKDGSTVGTAAYMSPEQVQGRTVDQRSDLFSLGVVLYEMMTGRLPFGGEHEAAIAYAITNEVPEPVARFKSAVPAGFQDIVNRVLEKDPSLRYQSAADLLADLKRVRRELEGSQPSMVSRTMPVQPRRSYLKYLVATSVVFVVALVLLILKPFKIDIVPEQKATAAENSLAVMYFDNLVDADDKDKTAQMITSLLITGLSESQYLQVVSRQRLYDILKLLGKAEIKSIDRSTATEVAQKAGVKWILTGDILQTQPKFVLTAEVAEAGTGKIQTTQRVTGETGEDLFAVVDKLSAAIRSHMSLPEPAKTEATPSVATVTTHSPDAYRFYLEGLEYIDKLYWSDAQTSFRKAVENDSTFAMAYFWLGEVSFPLNLFEAARNWNAKAAEYARNATWKEQQYIRAQAKGLAGDALGEIAVWRELLARSPDEKDALFRLGLALWNTNQLEAAAAEFQKVIAIDPAHKLAYNSLAYCYDRMGDFEQSLWAINQYIALAPNEPNPYDTRADLYAYNGKLDLAMDSYRKALSIKPDFPSLAKLGFMHVFKQEYAAAESLFQAMLAIPEVAVRSEGRTCLALIPLYQGRLGKALTLLNEGIAADRMERHEQGTDPKLSLEALIYLEQGNPSLAAATAGQITEISRRVDPGDLVGWRDFQVDVLCESGACDEAAEVAAALKRDIEAKDTTKMPFYWYVAGRVAACRGHWDEAIASFERFADRGRDFFNHYMLGSSCLQAGKLDKAVFWFEKALSRYADDRLYMTTWAVKIHYLLGIAYEQSGWKDRAVEQYQIFLDIWKDADSGIKEIDDAGARLAKLRA